MTIQRMAASSWRQHRRSTETSWQTDSKLHEGAEITRLASIDLEPDGGQDAAELRSVRITSQIT